jgi:hypothetical protein
MMTTYILIVHTRRIALLHGKILKLGIVIASRHIIPRVSRSRDSGTGYYYKVYMSWDTNTIYMSFTKMHYPHGSIISTWDPSMIRRLSGQDTELEFMCDIFIMYISPSSGYLNICVTHSDSNLYCGIPFIGRGLFKLMVSIEVPWRIHITLRCQQFVSRRWYAGRGCHTASLHR